MKNMNWVVAVALVVFSIGAPAVYADVVAEGATPKLVGEGYTFAEGPAVDPEGNVYFSDIFIGRIMKWTVDGKVSVFAEHTGGTNGLLFGRDGLLYACEPINRRVSKYSPDGTSASVAEKWDDRRFNQPNDLWIDAKGGIYFTDPIYMSVSPQEMDEKSVYYIKPGHEEVVRAATGFDLPNGIIGTPDGKTLYVADHGRKTVEVFAIADDGSLLEQRTLIKEGSDGMTLDNQGNLYLTGANKVVVYDKTGQLVEEIPMPAVTTNVTFAGRKNKTLFITTQNAVYTMEMEVAGAVPLQKASGAGKKKVPRKRVIE